MGILSKLFGGDKGAEKAAKDLLNGLFGEKPNQPSSSGTTVTSKPAEAPQRPASPESPSGFSWGEEMPAEENQFNYNGPFWSYFEHIFSADFPAYRVEKREIEPRKRIAYTLWSGASKAVVVELMNESCSAYKFRNDCAKEGVPYVRFYHDHDGWWNTREYVVTRIRGALKG